MVLIPIPISSPLFFWVFIDFLHSYHHYSVLSFQLLPVVLTVWHCISHTIYSINFTIENMWYGGKKWALEIFKVVMETPTFLLAMWLRTINFISPGFHCLMCKMKHTCLSEKAIVRIRNNDYKEGKLLS
jgi:hypothetical protein